jgi:hypothetical protein
MTRFIYNPSRDQLSQAGINLLTDDIRAVAIDLTEYTPNAAHEFLSDVPGDARIGTPVALTGRAVGVSQVGAVTADPTVFDDLAGPVIGAVICFRHTGNDATARLVSFTDEGGGLPFTPNGQDLTVTWPATGFARC